ncbi:MAG: hypothetical protein ACRDPM_01390 [Solirubrobacteraceae bacterium]
MSRALGSMLPRRALMARAVAAAIAALTIGAAAPAGAAPAMHASTSAKAMALHDDMRALWEAHGTWTERAIVDFVGGLPDTDLVVARLLSNQTDIGNAVKPYYGVAAGSKLTALLKAHINAAVGVLKAAKSGKAQSVATAKAAFFANGNQVAAFLRAANPHHWALSAMRTMMRIHLNQVIALAVDELDGHYAAAIRLYGVYIDHIIDMADMLSTGIIQQFPARF